MSESEMGNRVSKSAKAVKEQRVDGGSRDLLTRLRYTLMASERRYLISVLSKSIHSLAGLISLGVGPIKPWFVTGFTDAEGCFFIKVTKSKGKLPWRVNVTFLLVLHLKDRALLESIQAFFGGIGSITISGNTVRYEVSSVTDLLNVIIPHFEKYPLCTQKHADFLLWKQAVRLMALKQHLTLAGLLLILGLRANLNLGFDVSNIDGCIAIPRPDVTLPETLNPNWVAGFTSGDGGFFARVTDAKDYKIGSRTRVTYEVVQDIRDINLMAMLVTFFGCGAIYQSGTMVKFSVARFDDIISIIVPFFKVYPIFGVKYLNFLDWCRIRELIRDKKHLTVEGLREIKFLIGQMNNSRIFKRDRHSS